MDSRRLFAAALSVALLDGAHAQGDALIVSSGNRAISVELPSSAFPDAGGVLSIDIDGYDVSPFSRLDGATLQIELETPLSGGQHALSVVLFLPDGRAEAVLNTLLGLPEPEGGEWSLNTTLQTSYRTDQHPQLEFDDSDRSTGNGALSISGARTSDKWRLASTFDAIYDGNDPAVSANPSYMLPSYQVSATRLGRDTATSVGAGNIKIARDDLLFSNFQRRGAALETTSASGLFNLQLFSVASTPRNGFDGDYLAPDDANDRTAGVSAGVNLLDDRLEVSGGFVDGKTAFGGAGFNAVDDLAHYGGDGWNVALSSRSLGGSVWLSLEHAKSQFDADGIGLGFAAIEDDATQVRLRLSSAGHFGKGPFAYWSADFRHKRVGMDFFSVGNLSLPGNLEVDSASLQGGFDSIAIGVELSTQRTNPHDDPWLPTQRLRQTGIDLSYTPAALDTENGFWQKLGAPSLSAWIYRSDSQQSDEDAVLAGFDVDNVTDELGVAMTFSRASLSWGFEAGVVEYADDSDAVYFGEFLVYEPLSDSRNVQASLQLSWTPTARAMLDAYLQRNSFEESAFNDEQRSTNYGLGGTFFLVPDKLSLFLSVNEGRDRRRFGDALFIPENFRSRLTGMQLNWLIREATGRSPGLTMYVKGNSARSEDLVFLVRDKIWSLFVGANVTWARSR